MAQAGESSPGQSPQHPSQVVAGWKMSPSLRSPARGHRVSLGHSWGGRPWGRSPRQPDPAASACGLTPPFHRILILPTTRFGLNRFNSARGSPHAFGRPVLPWPRPPLPPPPSPPTRPVPGLVPSPGRRPAAGISVPGHTGPVRSAPPGGGGGSRRCERKV